VHGQPVTVGLLDPPLREFVPRRFDKAEATLLANALTISLEEVWVRIEPLVEASSAAPIVGLVPCWMGRALLSLQGPSLSRLSSSPLEQTILPRRVVVSTLETLTSFLLQECG